MKRIIGMSLVFLLGKTLPLSAYYIDTTNPQYVKVKIYEVRASANADCSNSIRIFSNSSPGSTDMVGNPTLGTGALPNGTYQCFMIKMSDTIHSAPVDTPVGGTCVAGQDIVQDIARPDPSNPGGHGVAPDGTTFALTNGEDIVWIYFRVGAVTDNTSDSSFRPDKGMPLTAPVTVTGDKNLTIVFDFDGRVGTDPNPPHACATDSPTMSIR